MADEGKEKKEKPEIDWKLVALSVLVNHHGNDGAWQGDGLVPKEWAKEIEREVKEFARERGYW